MPRAMIPAACGLAAALIAAPALGQTTSVAPAHAPTQFAIKADQGLARRLNPLIGSLAQPVTAAVPANTTPRDYLRTICGPNHPTWTEVAPTKPGERLIQYQPCLQAGHEETVVRKGENPDYIKTKNGFLPRSLSGFSVIRGGKPLPITTTLQEGDVVRTPPKPVWTKIETTTPVANGRAGLMEQLASRLECLTGETPAACLKRFNVSVLDNTPLVAVIPPPAAKSVQRETSFDAAQPAMAAPKKYLVRPISYFQPPPEAPSPPAPPPPPVPTRQSAESAVADGQWPYDQKLVSALLAARPQSKVFRSRIAVVDLGLRNDTGDPLPPESFGDLTPGARIGAGPPFDHPSGVGLCAGGLAPDAVSGELLNHGAVTASLAGGLTLRRKGAPPGLLPNLIFYRLYGSPCPPGGQAEVTPTDVLEAFHASLGWPIVNLSYGGARARDSGLTSSMKDEMLGISALLVVAAGNEGVDLADNPNAICPACFASTASLQEAFAYLVLAVGSANDRLRRDDDSNHGAGVVKLYAPGRPFGAVDLFGNDASNYGPSTSYAAPQVALALAMMRSLTRQEIDRRRLVDRILVSTWPLLDEAGLPVEGAGVLDLTKALAVNNYAVQVRRQENGRLVRRTFVGDIPGGLGGVRICPTTSLSEDLYQAIRLDGTEPGGLRTVRLFAQNRKVGQPIGRQAVSQLPAPCVVSGEFRMNTLPDGQQVIALQDVELILAPLTY